MKNTFYNEFDFERLQKSKRSNDYRTPFQIDRDRIIHSSEFRRLQGKTQVFIPGDYDFYRTRLTHSIEVAQIGRSICNYLQTEKNSLLNGEYFIDPDLVEAGCLAHDLGHPPFGHAGERRLNFIMKKYGGFEGNAQTLRLITENFYRGEEKRRGMNPTRALVDGVLKYKSRFSDRSNQKNHFLYDEQIFYIQFIFKSENYSGHFTKPESMNNFRSIECQIIDWADDTAYTINDIVDSVAGKFITIKNLYKWREKNLQKLNNVEINALKELILWIKEGNYKSKMGTLIGDFIKACSLRKSDNFMGDKTNRYKYELIINEKHKIRAELYKKIARDLVFLSPKINKIESRGNYMIDKIFEALEANYIIALKKNKLIEKFSDRIIRIEKHSSVRARLICDYIAGMTDSFAIRTYRKLFN